MKYTVHQDTATWMRVTHEVEVSNVEDLSEDQVHTLIRGDLMGYTDARVRVLDSTVPESLGTDVQGVADDFEFLPMRPTMGMDAYVHQCLLSGSRGGFAAALGDAWTRADSGHRAIMEKAFPHIFNIPVGV